MEKIPKKLLNFEESLNSSEQNEQTLSEQLDFLQYLCSEKIQLKITPLTNKKCMYCEKYFFDEKRDLLNIITCDCFQRVHVTCLEKQRENALKTNQQLKCYKCNKLFENNVIESGINYFHTNKDIQTNIPSTTTYNKDNINLNPLQKESLLLKCLKCKKSYNFAYNLDCSHQFCENCLKKYVQKLKSKIKNLNDFKCLLCKKPIPIENLQEILGKTEFEEINQKFLRKTIETNLNANEIAINCLHCKTMAIVDKTSSLLKKEIYQCQNCKKEMPVSKLVSKLEKKPAEQEKTSKNTNKCNIF